MCSNLAGGERHSPCGRVSTSWAKGHAEGLDYHVDVPEYVPDRIGIERVARYLIEVCILYWYARGRARQGPNTVAGAERGPYRFKSDAVAGTYDEDFGHDSPNSYLFSDQC